MAESVLGDVYPSVGLNSNEETEGRDDRRPQRQITEAIMHCIIVYDPSGDWVESWDFMNVIDLIRGNRTAGNMTEGKLKGAGLARYAQDGKRGRAGTLVRKAKRVNTWGVGVKEGKEIKKGAEILLNMAFIIGFSYSKF
jgi:hypothetical protein